MPRNRVIDLFIFDVNQTMFSLSEIESRFIESNLNANLVDKWFISILKEGFANSQDGRFIDFFTIAKYELEKIFLTFKKNEYKKDIDFILNGFKKLTIHNNVKKSLKLIYEKNYKIVTLTNGSKKITESMLKYNNCEKYIDRCFSIDELQVWKPNKKIYKFVCSEMNCMPSKSIMIACHGWDIGGAATAGLKTGYVQNYESKLSDFYSEPDFFSKNCFSLIQKII